MGRKGGGNILMAFGVVLALISGAAVFFVVQLNVAKGKEIPERPVVVALVDIPERTVITPDKVTVQQWPENIIPPGAIAKVEGVNGKFAKGKLLAKVAILDSQIAGIATEGAEKGPATPASAPGKSVQVAPEFNPNLIEKGKVLVAVTYPSAVPLIKAGAVFPGSRVDIIVEAPGLLGPQIAPVFRNIEVKFIGSVTSTTEAGATKVDSVLVFAVPPQ
ncbi:MAG: Pilus assembly protein CpaB, partial [Dehalococcoidia bacterium]|nr:Pilus assembly protein CpaB [Dehalococcoidia bacterium]